MKVITTLFTCVKVMTTLFTCVKVITNREAFMLIKLYIFSLVLGAFLLGASIFLGDADIDGDANLELDLDADADMDLDADNAASMATDVAIAGADVFLWTFKSVRFWTFFVAFFGLTGLALDGLDLLAPLIALPVAAGVGVVVGAFAHNAVRMLSKDDRGVAAQSIDYVGKTARVMIPLAGGRTGKIRIDLKGTTVDVLATSEDELGIGDEAIIIEMEGTNARVARLERGNG